MTELEQALIAAIVEATANRGGYATFGAPAASPNGSWCVEWWHPALVCPAWTQGAHASIVDAAREAAQRLGVIG